MNTNTNTTNNNHINTSLPTNIINSTSLPSSSSLLPLINSTTTSSTSTIINPSSSIVISSNPTTSRSINNNIPSLEFTSLELWKKLNVIGRGGSSTVYKVELVNNKQIVAMKEIQIDGLTKEQILAIEAEIDTMKSLNHMNIVNYLGTFRQQSNFYIFLEYAEKGSLRQFYQKNGKLTEAQASTCTKSMLLGLLYLHSNGIAHRDIKGANVLLAEGGEMKLADFGASKRLDTASIVSGLKGTPHWMAPEVIKGTQMSTGWMKADVWSLGCTVVEMLTGALPFSEYANPMTAMYHIANGKSPPISDDIIVSKEAREFVSLCCSVEPNDRPSVADLLEHAFITNQTTETYLYPLSSIDAQNIQVQQINTLDILSSSNEESSNKETNLNESINEILIDKEIEKSDKTRLSEGQMVLQKLNRVVVIDVTSKSSSPLLDETNIFQNQVTPVIHHTRKKRNQESPIPIGISNTPTLGNVTMSRNSQLLPPTGKKMDKKSTSNSKSSSPILKLDPISPSSVIRGTTSGEDTDRSSEYHNRTSRSNSTSSTVCATPIMMHDGSNDNYHMNSSCGIASCVSPPIITTELLPDDKLIIEQSIPLKNSTSAFGPRSRSNSGRFEFQIPVTISNNETENEIISPGPSLSRSVSIEDSLIDEKDGVLRPIAPLSGQKINICCELEQPIIIPEPKENRLSEIKEIKLTKKQSLKSIKPENKNMRSPIKQTNKNNNHNNHNNNHHHHHLNNNNINNNIYNNNNTNINNINNHSNTNTHNIRSKSASTVLTSQNVKVTLPPMQTLHESSSNFSLLKNNKKSNIPELPLRLVQSAPSLSQSINLPPLHSTTISTSPTIITSSSSSTSSSVNLCPNNSTKIQQHSISNKLALKLHPNNLATSSSCNKLINSHQKRPSFEAYEQEGGILAPRR